MVYLRACILDCLSTVGAPLRTFSLGDSSCAGRDLHSLQCPGICSRLARTVARSAPPGRGAGTPWVVLRADDAAVHPGIPAPPAFPSGGVHGLSSSLDQPAPDLPRPVRQPWGTSRSS